MSLRKIAGGGGAEAPEPVMAAAAAASPAPPAPVAAAPAPVEVPAPVPVAAAAVAIAPSAPAGGVDVAGLSPEDQEVHKKQSGLRSCLWTRFKLYNQAKVTEGRQNKDLYQRLKEDIDKSRNTYDKRYGRRLRPAPDISARRLIRIWQTTIHLHSQRLSAVNYICVPHSVVSNSIRRCRIPWGCDIGSFRTNQPKKARPPK